jgi:DNA-binding transcriptional regulator YhcF (GntR family)
MTVKFDAGSIVPLYQQVADELTAAIRSGIYPENGQVPSTTEISRQYQLNPATVLKGMNLLVADGLIEKRRGLGMFVKTGAQTKLRAQMRAEFFAKQVPELVQAAKELGISRQELSAAIKEEQHDN